MNALTKEQKQIAANEKRAATIAAKKAALQAVEAVEAVEAAPLELLPDEITALEQFEALQELEELEELEEEDFYQDIEEEEQEIKAPNNNAAIFETLELNDSFRASIDLVRAAIELSAPVIANDKISSDKARLTMLNRVNRCKRFDKMNKLSDSALSIIVNNSNADTLEKTAIYAVDKVIQAAKFISGERSIFGRGKNNSFLYLLRGIATHNPTIISREFAINTLTRYGQPHESADTQASSSCKALLALGCLDMIKAGSYTVNHESKLMSLLLESLD